MADSLAQRARKDPRLLRRALKNPALRSRLPSSMLRPAQRQRRARNVRRAAATAAAGAQRTRASQPFVPGGTLTQRQINRQAKLATQVRYGPLAEQERQQVGEAQNWQRDVGGYYDQYLRQVAQQSANVRSIEGQAQTAMQNLQGGVTGLATADLKGIQGQANQDAAARGATAGNQTSLASDAAAVRQALVGSFAAEQAARGAAASRYADAVANKIAPGQKLQAVAQAGGRVRQAREKQTATARERGAFRQGERARLIGEESKTALAREVATGKTAAQLAGQTETHRHNVAGEKAARTRIATGKATAADKAAIAAGKINQYGYTDADWRAMTVPQRRKVIAASKGGKPGSKGGGDYLTPGQSGAGLSQLTKLKTFAQKAKTGQPFIAGHGKQTPVGRNRARGKLLDNIQGLKSPALLSAALDAVYDGHLSPETVRKLHAAGYKVSDVSGYLGVGVRPKNPTRRNTAAYKGYKGIPTVR